MQLYPTKIIKDPYPPLGSVGGVPCAPHNTMALDDFDPSIEVSVAGLDGETLKVGWAVGPPWGQQGSMAPLCTTCNCNKHRAHHCRNFMTYVHVGQFGARLQYSSSVDLFFDRLIILFLPYHLPALTFFQQVRLPASKTGADLREMIRSRIPSKPGTCISLLHQAEHLSLHKTLHARFSMQKLCR